MTPKEQPQDLREKLLQVDPDWSYCIGGGRCGEPGGIYDCNLDEHVMGPEQVSKLLELIEEYTASKVKEALEGVVWFDRSTSWTRQDDKRMWGLLIDINDRWLTIEEYIDELQKKANRATKGR